jgi:hypothetical protein
MEIVTLKEVLTEMRSGNIFSIRWVTANKKKKTGGTIKQYDGCRRSRATPTASERPMFNGGSKKPNHYGNATRNIVIPTGEIRKLNVWLIIGFNGKKVVLY